MLPHTYIAIWALAIAASGALAHKLFAGSVAPAVFAWLWFNLFIAIYEAYVVARRRSFSRSECPSGFWKEPVRDGFWLRAWHEYTCYSDTRYLDPGDPVFIIEGLNAAIVALMWVALLLKAQAAIVPLLLLQALNCVAYFVTLYKSEKTTTSHRLKAASYLLVSSLWIIVPLLLLLLLMAESSPLPCRLPSCRRS